LLQRPPHCQGKKANQYEGLGPFFFLMIIRTLKTTPNINLYQPHVYITYLIGRKI